MPTWDALYAEGFAFTEPLPWVLHAAATLRDARVHDMLDLGCGTGRHLVWLEQQGFSVRGTDIAPHGLQHSRTWLQREGLGSDLALADMCAVPFAPAAFDAVLSIHVLYHATRAGMQSAIAEVGRVLRPGGLFVATFLSTRTWKYSEGTQLEPATFVQARGPEAGVPHHYCDEAEVRALLDAFTLSELHLDEFHDDAGDRHSHWEVLARMR